ncbi:hypothetical protein ERICIV_04627 (plasmid) [Paenibacillus larvae subsp. larvae]|uniref:Uncharacterized protein n=1 Tax=Paenibacillus larvae subsp. larvae TaxID=147375 RepID=A0A2L1U821_9BACL|nr:hypothetical protein ERICIII_05008 [Paenibacillus larvae subsp. larvae]AVF33389.1 hypothetical protein ERICIV_04627 [Paenibacillus larvae subsp. larvae]
MYIFRDAICSFSQSCLMEEKSAKGSKNGNFPFGKSFIEETCSGRLKRASSPYLNACPSDSTQ